jgi:predicted HTH transcriptional regulator
MPKSIQIKHSSTISDISAWHTLTLDDFVKYQQGDRISNRFLIESVYSVIKKQSGQVTTRHIEREIGLDIRTVRYAIKHLTKEGKIQRVRGLGINKIEFYYKICLTR